MHNFDVPEKKYLKNIIAIQIKSHERVLEGYEPIKNQRSIKDATERLGLGATGNAYCNGHGNDLRYSESDIKTISQDRV